MGTTRNVFLFINRILIHRKDYSKCCLKAFVTNHAKDFDSLIIRNLKILLDNK